MMIIVTAIMTTRGPFIYYVSTILGFFDPFPLPPATADVLYEWSPSLIGDFDEDDIGAGPAKKSRPSDQGYT